VPSSKFQLLHWGKPNQRTPYVQIKVYSWIIAAATNAAPLIFTKEALQRETDSYTVSLVTGIPPIERKLRPMGSRGFGEIRLAMSETSPKKPF